MRIVPMPKELKLTKGVCKFPSKVKILAYNNEDIDFIKDYFSTNLQKISNFNISYDGTFLINILENKDFRKEEYVLKILENEIIIEVSDYPGIFNSVNTLIQIVSEEIIAESPSELLLAFLTKSNESIGISMTHDQASSSVNSESSLNGSEDKLNAGNEKELVNSINLPTLIIKDKPRFNWRGMHLDVSRHFFNTTFIKKYLDILAFHKINIFHWHLTDDNGWRLEIKKYPKLQSISAWRVDNEDQPWRTRESGKEGEETTYGGFYTQTEVKEVIEYARLRNIEVIPEIEMPGHTLEVLAAYPELACFDGPFQVATGSYWPNKDIFCAGKEEVFEFLYNVLDEVIDLFPSNYIHIGGDEAEKEEWKRCPRCQQRMMDNNLKNEFELQSWFIRRIEKYLTLRGKKLIGWDEILEGGLAPEATVMSWRGVEGGIEAGKKGHPIIMCPQSHCYFDHYQSDPSTEKEAIGGYTPLKKVYTFEPIPEELSHIDQSLILGAQANVWTEWMPNDKHVEYMVLPRLAALCETVWSSKENLNWNEFKKTIPSLKKRYRALNWSYCNGSSRVEVLNENILESTFSLTNETLDAEIGYRKVGDKKIIHYKNYLKIENDEIFELGLIHGDKFLGNPIIREFSIHKAYGKKVIFVSKPSKRYLGTGEMTLTDGILGTKDLRDQHWLGFNDDDVYLDLDLGEKINIAEISLRFLNLSDAFIFPPSKIDLEIGGFKYSYKIEESKEKIVKISHKLDTNSSKVKFIMKQHQILTKNESYEIKPWIFIDQIIVR